MLYGVRGRLLHTSVVHFGCVHLRQSTVPGSLRTDIGFLVTEFSNFSLIGLCSSEYKQSVCLHTVVILMRTLKLKLPGAFEL